MTSEADTIDSTMLLLPFGFKPSKFHVICHRGKDSFEHGGNKRFRNLVSLFANDYCSSSSRYKKKEIVEVVVERIRDGVGIAKAGPHDCGLVRKNFASNRWEVLPTRAAHEKISQAFRDEMKARRRALRKLSPQHRVTKSTCGLREHVTIDPSTVLMAGPVAIRDDALLMPSASQPHSDGDKERQTVEMVQSQSDVEVIIRTAHDTSECSFGFSAIQLKRSGTDPNSYRKHKSDMLTSVASPRFDGPNLFEPLPMDFDLDAIFDDSGADQESECTYSHVSPAVANSIRSIFSS